MSGAASPLRVTFLGTGTSVGIPVLTCHCTVCTSSDPRNRRLRASLLLEWDLPRVGARPAAPDHRALPPVKVLVDTATDLRQQALSVGLDRVDAVLYTHQHADHVLGLDELRIYNFVHRITIPLYGSAETLDAVRRTFGYAFDRGARGVPRLSLHPVDGPFALFGRTVVPVPVLHAGMTVLAYRIDGFAYVTDCSAIPAESAELLQELEVLVIGALRRKPHPAHFSLEEALQQIERLRPLRAYLTHLGHELEHGNLESELPTGVSVAYDGLVLELGGQGRGSRCV